MKPLLHGTHHLSVARKWGLSSDKVNQGYLHSGDNYCNQSNTIGSIKDSTSYLLRSKPSVQQQFQCFCLIVQCNCLCVLKEADGKPELKESVSFINNMVGRTVKHFENLEMSVQCFKFSIHFRKLRKIAYQITESLRKPQNQSVRFLFLIPDS